jgi:type I restriction enzyme S subunit
LKLEIARQEIAEGLPQPPCLPHRQVADLFPDSFEDSELGEIPRGWEVGTLADLSILNPEVWTKETRPAKLDYVDLSNTKWGRIEAVTSYEAAEAPSRAQRVLRPADTIVGTVRPGNGSYAFISEHGLTGSTGFAVLRPQTAQYAEFVYLAATAADNIDTLAHLADGAAYPAVRPEVVAATPIVRPSDEVFGRFSRAAGPLLAKTAQHERESRTLAALRDALLPNLISGELRVEDPARFLGGSD